MMWWHNRTPREHILLSVLISLVLLFVTVQLFIRPALSSKMEASKAQSEALRDYEIVRNGLPKLVGQASPDKQTFTRSVVVSAANEAQTPMSRVQPGPDGSLQLWFEGVKSENLFVFLSRLTQAYNVQITRVQMSRQEVGTITAQITLMPEQ